MRHLVFLFSVLLGLSNISFSQDDKASDESVSQQLEGAWHIVRGTNQGTAIDIDAERPFQVIFHSGTVVTLDPDKKKLYEASFELDTSTRPFPLTMVTDMPNLPATKALGIMSLDGDRLSLCYALPGNDRPEKFESPQGSKLMLFEMKRAPSAREVDSTSPSVGSDSQQVLATFENLSGASVMNGQGEAVGTVDEIVVSLDRKLTHAIIRVGGVAGFASEQIAAPLQALSLRPVADDDRQSWLTLTASHTSAPRLETPDKLELSDPDWLEKNAKHFGVRFEVPKKVTNVKVSQLIDDEVYGVGGDAIAYFDDLIFQFGPGQQASPFIAILGYGGVLAVGKNYVAVDFEKLQFATQGDAESQVRLTLDRDATGLQDLQKVTPSDYPELKLQTVLKKVAP